MRLDTHPDLLIQPHLTGVKLAKPIDSSPHFPSVASLFAMPLMIYFVGFDAKFIDANYFTCLTNIPGNQGYHSEKDLKGTPLSKLFKKESVKILNYHNNNLLVKKALTIYDEQSTLLNDIIFSCISFKFPLFNSKDQMIGVFGISALTDNAIFKEAESLSTSMQRIIQTGLISPSKNIIPGFHINDIYFSKQEVKCLRLLLTGKTIKLIAQHMSLSPRTVEFYIENIKRKLDVKTKSELIEKVVQCIWPEMLL
ncbi:MAG: helix-turn-helix transcriptional regulator [Gammaproteobacteria bacterium]|nr:helix-turn-helix transcriptional regulator [Gammaproteobacteria bacterium]